MTSYTLTLLDVRRIQPYLFSANELKQCLGGSALVEKATHDWIVEALPKPNNVQIRDGSIQFDEMTIDSPDSLAAEVIFLGGGNAAILFAEQDQETKFANAKLFTKKYTRKVLGSAPGLEVAVAHTTCDWSAQNGLENAWKEIQSVVMPGQKEGHTTSQALLGLGVTAECGYTGLPAIAEVKDPDAPERGILVSAEAHAKNSDTTVKQAKSRINSMIPLQDLEYTDLFDELGGEKGRSSYIAVVHADGNSMGKRIQAHCKDTDNREMLKKMRAFSEAINLASTRAMKSVIGWLEGTVKDGAIFDKWYKDDCVRLINNKFPVRPIIFGGDDITFVSEGRLGLALAVKFIEELGKSEMPDGQTLYACAGVAIVSSHYPFSRAYQLAEELTSDAKKQARGFDKGRAEVSLINWYISTAGLSRNWEEIQKREYQGGKLMLRPLVIDHASGAKINNLQTWEVFKKQVAYFRDPNKWKAGRNKLKDLREVLRSGNAETLKFTKLNGDLPDLGMAGLEQVRQEGWRTDRCVYFDALEVDDFFIYPAEVLK